MDAAAVQGGLPLRRQVTIQTFLIADVRGYTRYTAEHGDEAAAALTARFAEIAREVVTARDGEVVELRGDEALAVFSSTRQAIRAAIALQARLGQEMEIDGSLPLQAGIGVDVGEAVPFEGGYRGGALNLAARLCALAGPGEVLLSEGVVHLARKMEGLAYVDRGEVQLKGLADPVRVIQVVMPADETGQHGATGMAEVYEERPLPIGSFLGSLPDGPIVAREEEMATLGEVVGVVAGGSGQLVVLAGDAGVGKTRLAQEVTLLVRDRGFLVATGRCYSTEADTPYFPFLEAIAMAYSGASPALRSQVVRRWPQLLRLLGESAESRGLVLDERKERPRLFIAAAGFFTALAAERPVALMLDDLHWADEGTIALWQHLARQTKSHRLLLLGTYQPSAMKREGALECALHDLGRERLVHRVTIHRLPLHGTSAMVAASIGGAEASEEFAEYVHRRTKGNPSYIKEILGALGGRYRLLREIGAGGMGRVFEAVDTRTGKHVAAKILFARAEVKLDDLLRFQQEGAVLGTLKHPHIVEVYGAFMEEHTSCIVMELLPGRPLAELIGGQPMALERVKLIALQVASALAYAHQHSIIHRDIKPDNIMVLPGDQVKVTDFGIARVQLPDTTAVTPTGSGLAVGTPLYSAPEQIEGRKVDGRADIYSLGAVLYQMLTGRPPFVGNDPLAIAYKHINEPPESPSSVLPELPSDWDELILKALSKDPAHRYPTVGAFQEAIAALGVEPKVVDRGGQRESPRRIPLASSRLRALTPSSGKRASAAPPDSEIEPAPPRQLATTDAAVLRGGPGDAPSVAQAPLPKSRWRSGPVHPRTTMVSAAIVLLVAGALAFIVVPRLMDTRHATALSVMGHVDPHWPLGGSAPGSLDTPQGIALDKAGNLYVADTGNNRIDEFSPAGRFLRSLGAVGSGPGQFRHPVGVAVDSAGSIYVSDSGNNRIQKLSPEGKWIASWGHRGGRPGEFRSPRGMAVDVTGNVLVADWGNDRVQQLSAEGSPLAVWGRGEAGPALHHPVAVALDPQGNIYVADNGSLDQLHVFTSNGTSLDDWGPPGSGAGQVRDPSGIAVGRDGTIVVTQGSHTPVREFAAYTHEPLDWRPRGVQIGVAGGMTIGTDGGIYVSDSLRGQVLELNAAGKLKARWGREPLTPAGFGSLGGLGVDRTGNVYVADTGHQRVVELSPQGQPIGQLEAQKVGYPQALATDRQGNLYVLDGAHFRVRRFSSSGKLLASWGAFGTGAGNFVTPQGIAVDALGNDVYVTDDGAGTIQKFRADGSLISIWTVALPAIANGIGSIALDRAGGVYVADSSDGKILKLSAVGRTLATWGSIGTAPGQFIGTLHLTVDPHGDIYVADAKRIQEFSPDGRLLAVIGGSTSSAGQFPSPAGIASDAKSDLFVTDDQTNRVYKIVPNGG